MNVFRPSYLVEPAARLERASSKYGLPLAMQVNLEISAQFEHGPTLL